MTQTRRGRPRKFEEGEVLEKALALFWRQGYGGTSLDDLAAATGLNRPSLYSAFGNKKEIFVAALRRFEDKMRDAARKRLADATGRKQRIIAVLEAALDVYTGGETAETLGCFVISTVPAEALQDADMKQELLAMQTLMDEGLRSVLLKESGAAGDTGVEAEILATLLFGLSARARAGMPREELSRVARIAVDRLLPD